MQKAKDKFEKYVQTTGELFNKLILQERLSFEEACKLKNIPGIYVFYENDAPVYAGRTRKLRQRLRAHVANSHNSASFALKRTREIHQLVPTYTKNLSRKVIATESPYKETFLDEINKIRIMDVQFLEVHDPIEQYLLELLASMSLDISLSGFDTS